jgi:isopenicillin N synthase-like dioxygenase
LSAVVIPTIPVIDLGGVRRHDAASLRQAAAAIRSACTTVGFFYIRNHGVPGPILKRATDAAREFFAHPSHIKQRVKVNARHRGFHALGGATMYHASKPDHKEFFGIGLELPESDPSVVAGEALRGPNNWPDFMPSLRPALYDFYDASGECGADLLRAVAVSLEVPEDFFASRYQKRMQRTQMVYYPPQPANAGADQFGVAPHTDYGCITLLWQDEVSGLQVKELGGEWIDAPPIPDTLVVNVGDLLARWSNDRFRSTPHRVVNRSGRERYSIATFYDPTYGAIVDPCDLNLEGEAPRYAPVAAGDYILGRINDTMAYRKA